MDVTLETLIDTQPYVGILVGLLDGRLWLQSKRNSSNKKIQVYNLASLLPVVSSKIQS